MAKVNFLNQAEPFKSASYISQLHGNANKKTGKRGCFTQGVIKKVYEKNWT